MGNDNKPPATRRHKTLEDLMQWAFQGHGDRSPWARMNIDDLLDELKYLEKTDGSIDHAIPWLEEKLGGTFSPKDRAFLKKVLRRQMNKDIKIHSRDVLQFMSDLFHRGSEIPPPWRS